MQGESRLTSVAQPDRLSLFGRFAEYEQRSLQHDVGESARQQQISNWDGVVFRLGDHYLTCRIDQVEEIIAFPGITPIPGAKEWLLGLASVRGNLAPEIGRASCRGGVDGGVGAGWLSDDRSRR